MNLERLATSPHIPHLTHNFSRARAQALVNLGRLAESAEAYTRVVELEPQDDTARREREEVMGKLQTVDSECHTPKRLCVR